MSSGEKYNPCSSFLRGGGVGINFHRVSCCGFEIMNTSANDKNFVPGHSIGVKKKLMRRVVQFFKLKK